MALKHGTAGKSLRKKLLVIAGIVIAASLFAYFGAKFSPILTPIAPLLGLVVAVQILGSKGVQRNLRSIGKGYAGEARIGKLLETLPSGWRVMHDLDLGGENVDHLVIGPGGVFNIEVKNYSGKVIATPRGLYNKGKRQDSIVRQAWRQSHKLREQLGVECIPILVFVGNPPEGHQVGKLMVMSSEQLLPFFKGAGKVWEYAEFVKIVQKAERLVK